LPPLNAAWAFAKELPGSRACGQGGREDSAQQEPEIHGPLVNDLLASLI
jgi:hypothetical protein